MPNSLRLAALDDCTLVKMPLRISSQTAGTPTSSVGRKAIRSLFELRTLADVSVLTRP